MERRWLIVVAIALGMMGLAWLLNGQSEDPKVERAAPFVLTVDDLATAAGSAPDAFGRTNPPVDVGLAERAAQGASLGRFSLPDARQVATYRRHQTGEEVTSVALLYDDPEQATGLGAAIAPLLSSTFQLDSAEIAIDGVDDARSWTSSRYHAISFRQGGVVSFVGTTRTDDPEGLLRLAETARDRVAAAQASAAAVATMGSPTSANADR